VSQGWQFTLSETSIHFLLALKTRDREMLLRAFEALNAEPLQRGDFEARDST
jgi:hypothetical protein